ncbi:MAG: FecR family protein [Calditrichia bacterium]
MNENEYLALFTRHFNGEITEKEQAQLDEWINASEQNRVTFSEYEKLWSTLSVPEPPSPFPVEQKWREFSQRNPLDSAQQLSIDSQKIAQQSWNRYATWGNIAAAVTILLLISSLAYYVFDGTAAAPSLYLTGSGERATHILPDGSTVKMNAGSELRLSEDFSETERSVYLKGEALFEVVHNRASFQVITDNALIEVLGTRFNVNSRRQRTEVVVQEGTVSLQNSNSDQSDKVILNQNQISACLADQPASTPQLIDSKKHLGWLRGKLIFTKTPLADIASELERTFNVSIKLANSNIGTLTVSGVFDETDIESILNELTLTLGLQYSYQNNTYYLMQAN